MPQRLSKQAEQKIRDILVANWNPANTADYDPALEDTSVSNFLRIHTGSYEATYADPQISITHPNGEDTPGATQYSGMQGDGSGPNQRRIGNPLVQCWAESETDYNGEGAEDIVRLLRLEIERIVQASVTTDTEFHYLSTTWDGRTPDDASPPVWQSQLTAQYEWLKTP